MKRLKTYCVDQSERSSGIKLEGMSIVGFGLLRLANVAWKGNLDGKGGLIVASKLRVFGGFLRLLRSDRLWLFLLWLLFLRSLLGGGLGGGLGGCLGRSGGFGVGLGFLRRCQYEPR